MGLVESFCVWGCFGYGVVVFGGGFLFVGLGGEAGVLEFLLSETGCSRAPFIEYLITYAFINFS